MNTQLQRALHAWCATNRVTPATHTVHGEHVYGFGQTAAGRSRYQFWFDVDGTVVFLGWNDNREISHRLTVRDAQEMAAYLKHFVAWEVLQ